MEKFKPLNFKSAGVGDGMKATVSIAYPAVCSLFYINTDNFGNVGLSIFGNADLYGETVKGNFSLNYLNTLENAEKVAQKLYQEGMNKLYDEIKNMVEM